MKKIFLAGFFLALLSCKTAQTTIATKPTVVATTALSEEDKIPMLAIEKSVHSFDTIAQGTPVKHSFVFTNVGKVPVILGEVTTPCGCTTPVWEKGFEIAPGKTSPIEVEYNAANEGAFEKKLTVYYNNAYMVDFSISGLVKAAAVAKN